jgi:N-acetylmuramoyl-L-alanine amidase
MKKILLQAICVMALILSFPSSSQDDTKPVPEIDPHTLQELRCLELNIHFEASGEPSKGKIAVGQVTMNRVKSGKFPDTVCGVVRQPYQFSWVGVVRKWHKTVVSNEIKQIAYNIYMQEQKDITKKSLYFQRYDVSYRTNYKLKIGDHIFF